MADEETKHEPSPKSAPDVNGGPAALAPADTADPALVHATAAPASHAPVHATLAPASHGHHGHGLAHTTPVWLLVAILGVLMVLTIVTVAVTSFDLGAQGNLVVAMVIATIKAALVVAFFMHLVWDKKLHLILFLTSVLFLILFLSLSVNDRGEYEPDIQMYERSGR